MKTWDWQDETIRRVFFDIETLPPLEETREQITRQVASALQSGGEKLSDETVTAEVDKQFRKLALSGEHGRLLAIGVIVERGNEIESQGILGRERATGKFHLDEARTLRAFWKLISNFDTRKDLIVGHNLMEFDLPFVRKRSIVHRVQPTVSFCFARYRSQPIYDTMKEWAHWAFKANISLDELTKVLGFESPKQNGIDGSHIYDLFREDRHDEIADYCMRDVEAVRSIYYRMSFLDASKKDSKG